MDVDVDERVDPCAPMNEVGMRHVWRWSADGCSGGDGVGRWRVAKSILGRWLVAEQEVAYRQWR